MVSRWSCLVLATLFTSVTRIFFGVLTSMLQQLLDRNIGILMLPLSPIIQQGRQNTSIGRHQRIFHFMNVRRMASLDAAGPGHKTKIAGIESRAKRMSVPPMATITNSIGVIARLPSTIVNNLSPS